MSSDHLAIVRNRHLVPRPYNPATAIIREQGWGMTEERVEQAAEEAVDDDRLLEGENPSTQYLDDATHWMTVYGELLGVKRDLLAVIERRLTNLQEATRKEVARTDLVVLDAEMRRFAERHSYWARRCEELVESGRG